MELSENVDATIASDEEVQKWKDNLILLPISQLKNMIDALDKTNTDDKIDAIRLIKDVIKQKKLIV